ncbi:DNRLRE domain-containing protein [Streptosporangium sp. NPDC001559]|uniref:DNRLRE domain-containing protein n=1 Tax=Streptosporangium sp. NPDC001559 TaxID=3366187 RepID=UPI0036E959BF
METAQREAKKQNKRVEIPSYQTETSTTFANPDGKTLYTELYSTPIRVQKNGTWQPVDTTLVEEDGVIRPKAIKGEFTLSAGGDTTLLRTEGDKGQAAISAAVKLPKPQLAGDTATYPSAYGPGIDLVITATPTGLQQKLVIRQRPAAKKKLSLRIPVDLPKGMRYGKDSSGKPALLTDKADKKLAPITAAPMLDATAAQQPETGHVGAATTATEQNGDDSALLLTPDASFLADPAVAYPVTIALASDTWTGTGVAGDTFVSTSYPNGNSNNINYQRIIAGKSNSGTATWRAYIDFNIKDTPLEGGTVDNADLRLWNFRANACTSEIDSGIVARRVTSDWTISNLTWSNQPTVTTGGQVGNKGAYSDDCSRGEGELYYSIETMVQAWMDGTADYGVQLSSASESDSTNWRWYRSYEYGGYDGYPGQPRGPVLFISYTPGAEPIEALYVRPRSSSVPTLNEVLAHVDDSVIDEPPDPDPVTPEELKSEAAQSTQVVGSGLKDAVLPDGLTPEEIKQWSNPNIGEDPTQPDPPKPAIAHWLFDEATGSTAADSTINDNKVTLNNTATWITGKSGHALSNIPTSQLRTLASQEAAKQSKPVEVEAETSETSITYAQPDGKSFTTEITAGPVRTQRNGVWAPIDTSLTEQDGTLKPKAIASGVAVEVSNGGVSAFVKMTAADGQSYALRWPTSLPKPTLAKNVATFTDAAGKGADLVITVLPTGFRHDVVLRERPTKPLELRIGVESNGLTLSKGKGGRLLLTRGKGDKLVASAPQPVMWDADARGRLVKGRRSKTGHAKITTDVVTENGRTELVLKPDQAFLANPATTYPVRIDPATTLPFNHDVELADSNDADFPADPTSQYLMAGRMAGWFLSRVYLRFDTTSLTGSTVTDAKLSLNNIDAPSCGTQVGAGIQARRVTGAWDENNLHWANKPASTAEDAQTNRQAFTQDCGAARMQWTITGIAQDWAAGAANHGLVLQHPDETDGTDNYRVFTASEDTDYVAPPLLTVTTSGPASAPTVTNLAVTPAQASGGTTTVTSLTPQLAATVTDAATGSLTGQFEIEHDPAAPAGQGTGQIWAGTSPAVASGSQATITVTAGKLTDGWKVRWRARAANATASTTSAWSAWQQATIDLPDLPSAPAVSALQVIPSALVGGTTTTSSLTPSLRAQVNDPAGGTLRADFEIEHDPAAPQGQGSGQIWAGSANNVAAGTQAETTVPAGKLTDGWKVRWRARAASAATTSPWSEWQLLTVDPITAGEEPMATAATPIIRTNESFTIAAWVRLNDKDGRYAIAEQKGTNAAPFHLGIDPAHGLVFTMRQADSATSSEEGALSEISPPVGEWFHLAGAYDDGSRTLSLYLNGNLIKEQTIGFAPWNADGSFTIGTSIRGGIDDLWVFPRGLSATEVSDLYTHPGATASTAAVTSAPHKAVTSRRAREEKGLTQSAAVSWPWPVRKTDPIRYEKYEDCDADVAQIVGFVNFRSRFSGCYSGQLVAIDADKINNTLSIKGMITGDITLLIDADQSSRTVVIRSKLNNVAGSGTLLFSPLGLKLKPRGYPSNANCKPVLGSPFGPNLREKSQSSWNANSLEIFGLESPATGVDEKDKDKITTCRFSLNVIVTPIGSKTRSVNLWTKAGVSDIAFKARCDSAKYVYAPSGGCVFTYPTMFMEMARNDVNERGETWPEQYDHIKKALTNPNAAPTYPELGGVVYPWSAGRSKNIPGGSQQNPLHRIANKDLNEKQREKSESVCHREIQRTWSGDLEKDPNALNCDEFPFASVEEGSLGANPDFNYSVRLIRADHNQAFGRALAAWYGNNRILKEDAFWIKLS